EDSKNIGRTSSKIFTLSTLVQAYSLSISGDPDPISNPDATLFRAVADHLGFVRAFWRAVSDALGELWLPRDAETGAPLRAAERQEPLLLRRVERNVAFQAVFLLALGRLGFALGELANWSPDSELLASLERLKDQDYRAYQGSDEDAEDSRLYQERW